MAIIFSSIRLVLHGLDGLINFILDLLFHYKLFIRMHDYMQISDRLTTTINTRGTAALLNVAFNLRKPIRNYTTDMLFHPRQQKRSLKAI